MATHTIRYPDYRRDEPRAIVWNDETGEIGGDHSAVPDIRRFLERERGGFSVQMEEGRLDMRDPRRDPADFLAMIRWILNVSVFRPHLLELPPALRRVEPTAWKRSNPGEGAVA